MGSSRHDQLIETRRLVGVFYSIFIRPRQSWFPRRDRDVSDRHACGRRANPAKEQGDRRRFTNRQQSRWALQIRRPRPRFRATLDRHAVLRVRAIEQRNHHRTGQTPRTEYQAHRDYKRKHAGRRPGPPRGRHAATRESSHTARAAHVIRESGFIGRMAHQRRPLPGRPRRTALGCRAHRPATAKQYQRRAA